MYIYNGKKIVRQAGKLQPTLTLVSFVMRVLFSQSATARSEIFPCTPSGHALLALLVQCRTRHSFALPPNLFFVFFFHVFWGVLSTPVRVRRDAPRLLPTFSFAALPGDFWVRSGSRLRHACVLDDVWTPSRAYQLLLI